MLRDPSFSSPGCPSAVDSYSVSPRASITRRNAHLVRDGGPHNGQRPLETIIERCKGRRIRTRGLRSPEFLIRVRRLAISRKALSRLGQWRWRWLGLAWRGVAWRGTARRGVSLVAGRRPRACISYHGDGARHWSGNTNRAMEIATLTSGKSLFY